MLKTTFTLVEKKILTHNVFELVYSCPDMVSEMPSPGQYVMFQLAPGLNRAYSFASYKSGEFTLIIKRVGIGKWSPIICDAEVGTTFTGMLPLGHFILQNTVVSKCFIWTGTGFAPLYAMVLELARQGDFHENITFLYGVINEWDAFYTNEIKSLCSTLSIDFRQYFSEDTKDYATTWLVTEWILRENIASYQEFYICGSPAMVRDARAKLEELGVPKESVFFEPY